MSTSFNTLFSSHSKTINPYFLEKVTLLSHRRIRYEKNDNNFSELWSEISNDYKDQMKYVTKL
ncbi:hypothetical protein EMIT07CA2_550038 [Brevibacillus sp. IT-7CA2]